MELHELMHYPICFLGAEWELSKDSAYTRQQNAHAQKQSHRY